MGCGDSKNVTAPLTSNTQLGSVGSSQGGSDEEAYLKQRTWGSPAPPLPSIPTNTKAKPEEQSMDYAADNISTEEDLITRRKSGFAFTIQDENSPVTTITPPRRLQALKGNRRLTSDDLLKKQREHTEKRERILSEQKEKLRNSNRRVSSKSLREFEEAQRLFTESEKKAEKVQRNKEELMNEKLTKVRKHNSKVAKKRQSSLRDSLIDNLNLSGKMENDGEYNKSESGSWADNDSIKNIYDQMDYIKPVSGLAQAVQDNETHSDDEFFS